MRQVFISFLTSALLLTTCCVFAAIAPKQPLKSGTYTFKLKYAEHPNMEGPALTVKIRGKKVKVINPTDSSVFPKGVLAEGKLHWHAGSGKWIIATSKEDLAAPDVGGCSDGPDEIDLVNKIYWTC